MPLLFFALQFCFLNKNRAIIQPAPPNVLPTLNPKISECERCYKNRECMMYASSSSASANQLTTGHRRLAEHFTSHLNEADLTYFRHWDRLIDLERHASSKDKSTKSWLVKASEKEMADGDCISSLIADNLSLSADISTALPSEERANLRFMRSEDAEIKTPLNALTFERGNFVVLSTDTFFSRNASRDSITPKMHILKGFVEEVRDNEIDISVLKKDIVHVKRIVEIPSNGRAKFRLDKDQVSNGTGLLFQNLVNFLTLGKRTAHVIHSIH